MYLAAEILSFTFLFFGSIQLLLGLLSLRSGFQFKKYVLERLDARNEPFPGHVTVIVPCKGLDAGLETNLSAILNQEHPNCDVIFVVDSIDDPAVRVINEVISTNENAKLVVAGKALESGQKVHNLIAAVQTVGDDTAAFVFADSDACPSQLWLENILSPLNREETGASTGYRWFVQKNGGFATHLRSVWNASIASALGPNAKSNFCWGGSTAIRQEVFEELEVLKSWQGTVSDDFALSNLLGKSKYEVHFEPKCLIPTVEDTNLRELFEFTTRQMKITRRYSNGNFKISFIGSAVFTITVILGVFNLLFATGTSFVVSAFILLLIWLMGTVRELQRVSTIIRCITVHERKIRNQFFSHGILWPVSTILFFIDDIAALFSRRIIWRGISYELVSENEIRIIDK